MALSAASSVSRSELDAPFTSGIAARSSEMRSLSPRMSRSYAARSTGRAGTGLMAHAAPRDFLAMLQRYRSFLSVVGSAESKVSACPQVQISMPAMSASVRRLAGIRLSRPRPSRIAMTCAWRSGVFSGRWWPSYQTLSFFLPGSWRCEGV
ncbi:MAG: hypothetical protein FJZ01_13675 [Candidatus Sericytochromatia bacterium]|nr:hypothetical protein [Candidatus Tanganyikabacteria bacterium]